MRESFAIGPDGTRLYVRARRGPSAKTLFLCDGLVCDGFIYKYLWDDAARVASAVHWHYRGHGRSESPRDRARIAIADHASDLDAVRRHVGDPPAVLVGHSMGTQVALEAFRRRRDGIRGLVLLCGSFGRVTHTFKGTDLLATAMPKLIEQVSAHPKIARALWSRVPPKLAVRIARLAGEVDATSLRAEDMEPYFDHAAHVDFEMFLRMLQEAGAHSAEDLLEQIDVPVLVVAGGRDSFTPPALSEAMAERLPRGQLFALPEGTHVAPLEHHDALAERIVSFLEDLAP